MKKTGQLYWCKKCNTFEFIPDSDGTKASDLKKVVCSICKSKRGHHTYKMYKVTEDTIINTKEVKIR